MESIGICQEPSSLKSSGSVAIIRPMGNDDHEGPDRELLDRIGSLMQATEQAHKKQVTNQELQTLKTAASRLEGMLKDVANADAEVLKTAAARLDQLIQHIDAGEDVTAEVKRRRQWKNGGE